MENVLAEPGMVIAMIVVVTIEIFSLLFMGIVILAFRRLQRKQQALL